MSTKSEKEHRAREFLRALPWAKPLLAAVDATVPAREGHLFELRFAYEIGRAGLVPDYEHETGVGGSSVDFAIGSNGITWNVELVSLSESDAVKGATSWEEEGGVRIERLFLGHDGMRPGIEDLAVAKKHTPEHEMLRCVTKIEEKVCSNRNIPSPTKFPVPDGHTFNIILVDVRAYEGIGDPDRDHCGQIVHGPNGVKHRENVMWVPQSTERIRGVLDSESPRPGAVLARQRIHVVAFVHEEDFDDDEIRETTVFFGNPELPFNLNTYPLLWAVEPGHERTPLRTRNALWNDG